MLKAQIVSAAVAGWLLLNCLTVGAYQIYQEYKAWNFDAVSLVNSLDIEGKNQLAEALFAHQDEPVKKKKG